MIQLVYKNKVYMYGNFPEVLELLKELSAEFKTLKEFLDYKTQML